MKIVCVPEVNVAMTRQSNWATPSLSKGTPETRVNCSIPESLSTSSGRRPAKRSEMSLLVRFQHRDTEEPGILDQRMCTRGLRKRDEHLRRDE